MKIKKLLSVALSILFVISALSLYACGGEGDNDNGIKFTEQAGALSVIGYEGEESAVVIPETYNGKTVTKISAKAFEKSSLLEITIPKSIIEVGDDAFLDSRLTKVTYLGTIDQWVKIKFQGEGANPISVSKNLVIDGQKVTTVTLTTADKVGDYAFFEYTPLVGVDIGDNVVKIGVSSFDGCSLLTQLDFGDKLEEFDYRSFGNCSSLESVTFTNGIKSIGRESFRLCTSLKSVYIPESVTLIEIAAFNYNTEMVSVIFEVTEGWYLAENLSASSGVDVDEERLLDEKEAAELLSIKEGNNKYFWKRG